MKVGVVWVGVLLVVVAAWIPLSHCSKKPVGVARKEDIPFTKCQVCQKLAKELYQQVQNKQGEIAPKKAFMVEWSVIGPTLLGEAEMLCTVVDAGLAAPIRRRCPCSKLSDAQLVEQDSEGQCNFECKTIERACQEVIGYSDTDVAEYLYSSKPDLDSLLNYLCKDLTKACSTKPPPVPKDRTLGEPFVAKSSKEAEMEKLLKSMGGTPGAPSMKMYSREDLMNMKNFDGKDADDEDEDDEASFPLKLGKVLRAKESGKRDWKQMIKKGIKDTSVALKKHANRVSNHMRQWWRGKKATTSKKG